MEITERERAEIKREVRSELAREAVAARWARLNEEERRDAVKAANAGRRLRAKQRREAAARGTRREVLEILQRALL